MTVLRATTGTSLRNATAPNSRWPNLPRVNPVAPLSAAATATCSQISSHSGSSGIAASVNTTPGAVGYIDLADAVTLAPNAIQSAIRNATNTTYIDPAAGSAAACSFFSVAALGGINGNVGLTATDNWSYNNNLNVNSPPVRSDVTQTGSDYPLCGMTFAMVYTGIGSTAPGAGPVPGLTNNQRRTLYSFLSHSLTNVAQDRLQGAYYARLPQGMVNNIRRGFQQNF